ncbi:MAG TPA: hypothetical protein VE964_06595 [Myxococcales bacterium]|nr:hypothetical protein [Myxococcales bacterium]
MRAANPSAIVFAAALAACGKGVASYSATGSTTGFPGESAPLENGGGADAGPDGGLPDAGTPTCAFPPSSLLALDGCAGGTAPGIPQPAALIGSCSDALLITTAGTSCSGTLSGSGDAFTGTCNVTGANAGQFPCTAKSLLPGDVQCALGSSNATCTIKVCIEGRDGGCSP